MIDFLRGRVAHLETEYVVLDVHGVGYRVFTPNPYGLSRTEEPVQLFIHHHVREDAIQLFGFPTREEQSLFRKLLDVSGIGPKVALGVLAGGRPDTIAAAIQQENVNFLTKLPGIGRKTAQRMILDLKDKLGVQGPAAAAAELMEPAAAAGTEGGSAWAAAREALAGLGYREAELDRAWSRIQAGLTGDESPDALMKKALQQLFQG
ncbi:Holliday junction branch migration protein RuvA [Cohnella sp. CFH 77786]|uniref:Holliday junction branch migration protein RuvA n=1 Tax=Cohnella sp. CFH 77786 TaxID=2662265 RepID=UPI001C608370|nr:Holliday junction branch migration protein RuvA [Cohnella sp. CFH 77786]MBW5447887.1 Holliday junction branch migration protein RuvA [Cohnella sp. CFH 77786]